MHDETNIFMSQVEQVLNSIPTPPYPCGLSPLDVFDNNESEISIKYGSRHDHICIETDSYGSMYPENLKYKCKHAPFLKDEFTFFEVSWKTRMVFL